MNKTFYLIINSLLLSASGFVNYYHVQNSIIERVEKYSFYYESMHSQLYDSLKFGFLCGITPLLLHIIWSKTKTEKVRMKFLSILVFLTVVISYIITRIVILNLKNNLEVLAIKKTQSIESLDLTLHIFLAQLLGFMLLYFILKNMAKTSKKD